MKLSKLHQTLKLATLTLLPAFISVQAQQTAAEDDLAIEKIMVTAQRKSENMQQTPVAVSAFSARDIERMQIDNVKDIAQVAPNVNFKPVTGGSAGVAPFIRGGGTTDGANITSENEIGIYIDDIYQPRSAASFIEMLEIERIEILRGPQGMLYGRNSSAGALKIVSRLPDDMLLFKNEAGIGSWNERYNKLYVAGPLNAERSLRGGFSGMYRKRDGGRQYNVTQQKDVGAEEYIGGQGDLYYEADDKSARFKVFYSGFDSDGLYASSLDPTGMALPFDQIPFTAGSIDQVLSPFASNTSDKQYGSSLHLTKKLSDSRQLTSISSWSKLDNDWAVGFSGGVPDTFIGGTTGNPLELFERVSTSSQNAFTQELQLQGNAFDEQLSYVGGLYYFRENGVQQVNSELFFAPTFSDFIIDTDSYALFGQTTIKLTAQLNLTLGARYTEDKKSLFASVAGEIVDRSDTFNKFTPKAALDYQLSNDVLLYASYTEGFKAGGYNGLASNAEALNSPYDMQSVKAYELGLKSEWLQNRLQLNLAAFFNDNTKLQQGVVTDSGMFITENYDAELKGIEAELKLRLNTNWSLWANGVLQDSEYTDTSAEGGASTGGLLGNRMANVFDFQYAIGIDYSRDLGPGIFNSGVNINRRADFYSTSDNAEIGHVPALTLIDAYASYAVDRWKVTLAGKNLTDEKYWFTGFGFAVVQPRFMADPLTWRLSVSYQL